MGNVFQFNKNPKQHAQRALQNEKDEFLKVNGFDADIRLKLQLDVLG
jgi:hypothetical protein